MTIQPLLQWKWDNERDAVLADDAREKNNKVESRLKAIQEREDYLRRITMDHLRSHRFFAGWKGYPSAKATRASRKIMAVAIEEMIAAGKDAPLSTKIAILQKCIESFNELDAELHFIETVEREDICAEFEAMVHACGLSRLKDLADRWREW